MRAYLGKRLPPWVLLVNADILINTLKRWGKEQDPNQPNSRFYTWGDYVQMLYTSGLAILLGSTAWFFFSATKCNWERDWSITLLATLMIIFAIYNDARKWIYESFIYDYKDKRRTGEFAKVVRYINSDLKRDKKNSRTK
jgi:hypothetical protein